MSVNSSGDQIIVTSEVTGAGQPMSLAIKRQLLRPGWAGAADSATVTVNADGTITQAWTTAGVTAVTTFNADGTITEVFSGAYSATRTTTIGADGAITQTVS